MLNTIEAILTIVYILVCVALTVIVLMQEGKDAGLSAITGGVSGGSDTYWSKNIKITIDKVDEYFIYLSLFYSNM